MTIQLSCNCDGTLCEGLTFPCETYRRDTPICRGSADAKPDDCDECWTEK